MSRNESQQESSSFSRRRVLAASAWAVPVVAIATAAPAYASSAPNPLWVAAVRLNSQESSANRRPGFRFGFDGQSTSVMVTVTIYLNQAATFDQLFNRFDNIPWSQLTPIAVPAGFTHAYSTTATFNLGPSGAKNVGDTPSGAGTKGLTIKTVNGRYTANIIAGDYTDGATFDHPFVP